MAHTTTQRREDKRHRERYLCDDRFGELQMTLPGSADVVSVTPINFNCYGLAFFANQPIPDHGVVKFDIHFKGRDGMIELQGMLGELIYSQGSDVGYYCGAAFVSAQVEVQATVDALCQIEQTLAESHDEKDRYGERLNKP